MRESWCVCVVMDTAVIFPAVVHSLVDTVVITTVLMVMTTVDLLIIDKIILIR